jgi:hypothetical protein
MRVSAGGEQITDPQELAAANAALDATASGIPISVLGPQKTITGPGLESAPANRSLATMDKKNGRVYETALEAKDKTLKTLGDKVRLGFANPTLDFQNWAAYVARAKSLGSKQYAHGGKVTANGLG